MAYVPDREDPRGAGLERERWSRERPSFDEGAFPDEVEAGQEVAALVAFDRRGQPGRRGLGADEDEEARGVQRLLASRGALPEGQVAEATVAAAGDDLVARLDAHVRRGRQGV